MYKLIPASNLTRNQCFCFLLIVINHCQALTESQALCKINALCIWPHSVITQTPCNKNYNYNHLIGLYFKTQAVTDWSSWLQGSSLITRLSDQIRSDQLLSLVWLFATPWIAAHQASLSITNFQSSLRLTSIESVMPSSHLILCCPLLLLPPIPPSIRVFSNESTLHMRWPKYWRSSFSIIPSKEIPGLISFRMDCRARQ